MNDNAHQNETKVTERETGFLAARKPVFPVQEEEERVKVEFRTGLGR